MPYQQLRPLIRKLSATSSVPPEVTAGLLDISPLVRGFGPDEPIVREGDRPVHVAVVLSGFVYRYKIVDPGKRQIIALHVAGDMPDLQGLHLEVMDHAVAASAGTQVAFIPHAVIFSLMEQHPRLERILWREALIDGAIFREWVVNVGARGGLNRVAHLFCEVLTKSRAVGLTQSLACSLPLSQAQIADATGLSSVHANRVLQSMRKRGLIKFEQRTLTVLDWEALKDIGDFDATYLHFKSANDDHTARPHGTRA
jgi:CRP-like cAMP-binding protein